MISSRSSGLSSSRSSAPSSSDNAGSSGSPAKGSGGSPSGDTPYTVPLGDSATEAHPRTAVAAGATPVCGRENAGGGRSPLARGYDEGHGGDAALSSLGIGGRCTTT